VVGYVGRLTHLKGVDLLASAFREMSLASSSLRLLIVGSGTEETRMRGLLAKELAQGLVHIEGDVDHSRLAEWYRAIDLFLMPSRYENFSNAVLEAMACGIPFLASDVGGNKIFAKTGAGWLFQPDSVSSLCARLGTIAENPLEIKVRGEIAARYARDCYDWSVSAERLERIISSRLGVQR